MLLKQMTIVRLSAIVLAIGGAANAASNLVVNGDFSAAVPNIALVAGNLNPTSWNYAGGVAYVYGFGAADTIGGNAGGGIPVYLWGPGNPAPGPNSVNGLTASSCPTCGNYLASDSDKPFAGAFTQLIVGLAPGQT